MIVDRDSLEQALKLAEELLELYEWEKDTTIGEFSSNPQAEKEALKQKVATYRQRIEELRDA